LILLVDEILSSVTFFEPLIKKRQPGPGLQKIDGKLARLPVLSQMT